MRELVRLPPFDSGSEPKCNGPLVRLMSSCRYIVRVTAIARTGAHPLVSG